VVNPSVVILGAGVVGLCTALECARRGFSVTVIDRKPRRRDGCSFGNAGMVVPSHFIPLAAPGMVSLGLKWMWNPESPFYIRPRLDPDLVSWGLRFWRAATRSRVEAAAPVLRDLGLLSRECFTSMGLDLGLVEKGLLMLCKEEQTLEEESHTAAKANELGIPAEVLDARATAALDPAVKMDVYGSVWFPKDCHLSPGRFLAVLEEELIRLGVVFHWETEVLDFDTSDSRLKSVSTSSGSILGETFILCAGVWSAETARALRLNLPMQGGKGYSLTLTKPPQLPDLCSICTEARVAVTPMDGTLRFGGTMELAGTDESIARRRVQGIIYAATRYFPAFAESDFAGIEPWRGLRPVSPDGMPYLGRTRRWKNLLVATGHAMMGLSLAPATGRIVADLLEEKEPEVDLRLLDPERFG
jgi:D-amino-acid dehydrogenase